MNIHDLFKDDRVVFLGDVSRDSKFSTLRLLLEKCIEGTEAASELEAIWTALESREKSMSTGIGQEVAIPHCSVPSIKEPRALFALIPDGLDFDAIDDKPVRIMILLLMPPSQANQHIQVMAMAAKLLSQSEFRSELMTLKNSTEVQKCLFRWLDKIE